MIDADGNLTLIKPLDRETTPGYILTISATDNPSTGTPKSSSISVVIAVSDVNDNPPKFVTSPCQAYVSDSAKMSTNVLTVSATDIDYGKNAEIIYSLVHADSNFVKYFKFDENKRVLFVNGALNLDAFGAIELNIYFVIRASDKGVPQLNSTVNCTATITGDNKHAPKLLHDKEIYSYIDDHNTTLSLREIAKINATDDDYGPDGEISFAIVKGNDEGVFIVSADGKITVAKTPDIGFYYLTLNVQDQATPTKRKQTICFVYVFIKSKRIDLGVVSGGKKAYDEIINMSTDDIISIPFYVQVGWNYLEGLDIEISFPEGDLIIENVTSDFNILKTSNHTLRIIGLMRYESDKIGIIHFADVNVKALKNGSMELYC